MTWKFIFGRDGEAELDRRVKRFMRGRGDTKLSTVLEHFSQSGAERMDVFYSLERLTNGEGAVLTTQTHDDEKHDPIDDPRTIWRWR